MDAPEKPRFKVGDLVWSRCGSFGKVIRCRLRRCPRRWSHVCQIETYNQFYLERDEGLLVPARLRLAERWKDVAFRGLWDQERV